MTAFALDQNQISPALPRPPISCALLLCFLLAACGKQGRDGTPVLAQAGATELAAGELSHELASESPYLRRRFNSSLAEKKRFVEALVRSRLLFAEAQRRGLDQDPQVQRRLRHLVIERLTEVLQQEIKPEAISEAELSRAYEAEGKGYGRPAMARVSQIVTATRPEAERLRAELDAAKDPGARFRALAQQHNLDAASRLRAGDLGYLHEQSVHVPKEIAAAAQGLKQVGDIVGPVQVRGRWVLLLQTAELAAASRSADQVKSHLRQKLLAERRVKAAEALLDRLRGGGSTDIDEEALAKVSAPVSEEKALSR